MAVDRCRETISAKREHLWRIVLTAKYIAKTGNGDQVEGLLRRMAPLVSANEPGCKLYHANRSAENPDIFLLYEHYADQAGGWQGK